MDNFTDFWCFRLGSLSRKINRYYNKRLADYGITLPQSFILFDLINNEGSNVKDIAARVQLDPPAVTGLIDRLLKENLVIRVEDPADRRSLQINLTNKGRSIVKELFPIAEEFNQHLKNSLDKEDIALFEKSLTRLEDSIN